MNQIIGFMRKTKIILVVSFCILLVSCKESTIQFEEKWQLTFSDEFNGDTLDYSVWKSGYDWGQTFEGNDEAYYVDSALKVHHGMLQIVCKRQTVTGNTWDIDFNPHDKKFNFISGLIQSGYGFSQRYGYFEIRCKLPYGSGYWPAFWMMTFNAWPPEIDIFEAKGTEPTTLYLTNHFRNKSNIHKQLGNRVVVSENIMTDFNTYAIEWDPYKIKWFFNNELIFTTTTEIPQVEMFLIINLALGGDWAGFSDELTPDSASMFIDYVRVYSQKDM